MLDLKAMLCGSVKRLAHVYRYSSLPVSRRENVAEHTAFVALFCLVIAKDLEDNSDVTVDRSKLLTSALLHDLDESLSGDFLRSVKLGVPGLKPLLDKACEGFLRSISTQLGVDLTTEWSHAKDSSLEGQILEVADLLGVASYLFEEFSSGNHHIFYILSELDEYLKKLQMGLRSELYGYVLYARNLISHVIKSYSDARMPALMLPSSDGDK
jgi:5'-deoxynucleotidase YfbR-like HD superfamily hydrolase